MDHVEECPSYYVDCWGTVCYCDYPHICICRELRACEERMINSAREAVRNECFHDTDSDWCVFVAAIDALGKEGE